MRLFVGGKIIVRQIPTSVYKIITAVFIFIIL